MKVTFAQRVPRLPASLRWAANTTSERRTNDERRPYNVVLTSCTDWVQDLCNCLIYQKCFTTLFVVVIFYLDSYAGLWEVPLSPLQDDSTQSCTTYESCVNYALTSDGVYNFLMANFLRHYDGNKAPFTLAGHASWMLSSRYKYRKNGTYKVWMGPLLGAPSS